MSYPVNDPVELPAFGAEPPYLTAVEGLPGVRTGQNETSTAPLTYTESERPVTNMSAFGENVTDDRGSPHEPTFGDTIQRPQSLIDELHRENFAAQMAGMNLAAEEEREKEAMTEQKSNGTSNEAHTTAYTFAGVGDDPESPPDVRSEQLEQLLNDHHQANANIQPRAGQMRMPNMGDGGQHRQISEPYDYEAPPPPYIQ